MNAHRIRRLAALLPALALLAGCGGQPPAASQPASQASQAASQPAPQPQQSQGQGQGQQEARVKLVFGDIVGAEIVYAPFQIALKKGYFAEEGIDVETKIYPNGPTMMLSMAKGEVDVAHAGTTPVLQAVAEGLDAVTIMSIAKDNAPIVGARGITDLKQLNGKKVGTPGLGTIHNTMLSLAAQKYGIKVEAIHAKVTDLVVMLEKGEIDGFTAWEWIAADAVNRLGANYLLKRPIVEGAESNVVAVQGKLFRESPRVVERILRAYLKAYAFLASNKQESHQILASKMGRPNALDLVELVYRNQSVTHVPDVNMEDVRLQVEDAIKTGKIKPDKVPDVNAFLKKAIDASLLQKAKAAVGYRG